MIRVWALFPVFGFEPRYKVFSAFYFIEDVSFYMTIFFFGAMYYEVSLDLERMVLYDWQKED